MLSLNEWTSIVSAISAAAASVWGAYKWAKKQSTNRIDDILDANVDLRKELRLENKDLKSEIMGYRQEIRRLEELDESQKEEIRRLLRENNRLTETNHQQELEVVLLRQREEIKSNPHDNTSS